MNNKIPYNCVKDKRGYIIPKCPVIKTTPDIIEWLRTTDSVRFLFNDMPNTKSLNKEWLNISISRSNNGTIYAFTSTWNDDEFEKYFVDNPTVKVFDENYEAFKKYMCWISKFGSKFAKQNF